ncbi:serine hydrolase domain-containing protein [Litchfieldia alkalitelluris]|uniref:serine hydrolase domain-containing protein n=1 Tax=Litchfieldia alkalitelluris TaxID=304268 RepID=UPI0009987C72|nr:serine hydrolase [Litchfieldia alkalitelluris]
MGRDVTSNTNIHSIRKSLLNSLYGIQLHQGNLSLNDTVGMLGIEDHSPLSSTEKEATVAQLMSSSSGIYHPASEESRRMMAKRPKRGSKSPGTHFYYNNWDFNVLGTIYNHKTKGDLFQDFQKYIAEPIGMEDFQLDETTYHYDKNKSVHPAYLFRMSTRDLARFGLLYLNNGKWKDKQIVPQSWIAKSTSVKFDVPSKSVYGYGYLWWVADEGSFKDLKLISAVGRYGQSIDIIPVRDLVFVHKVDSNKKGFFHKSVKGVSQKQRLKLLSLILEAQETSPVSEPKLIPFSPVRY